MLVVKTLNAKKIECQILTNFVSCFVSLILRFKFQRVVVWPVATSIATKMKNLTLHSRPSMFFSIVVFYFQTFVFRVCISICINASYLVSLIWSEIELNKWESGNGMCHLQQNSNIIKVHIRNNKFKIKTFFELR